MNRWHYEGSRNRSQETNEACRLLVLVCEWPILVFGAAKVRKGQCPQSDEAAMAWVLSKFPKVTERQIVKAFGADRTRRPRVNRMPDISDDNELAAIEALRAGGTLQTTSEVSGLPRPVIDSAWIAAEKGQDQEFGARMRKAKGEYDLSVMVDPRQIESRRKLHEAGAWAPRNNPADRRQRYNWFAESAKVETHPQQLEIADILKEVNPNAEKIEETESELI